MQGGEPCSRLGADAAGWSANDISVHYNCKFIRKAEKDV